MQTRLFVFFVILMVFVGCFQFLYDSEVNYFSERDTFVALPPGKTLKVLSFGYRNLVADSLFIWSIQFYSSYYLSNRYDYIEHIFNVITDLAPEYEEPYIVGAWIMALEKKDYKMAIRLLEKGSQNIPEEYLFDYEAGYYAFKHLKDFDLAEKLYKRASEKPNAPALIKRSWAHMVYMKDNLDFAWQIWMDIYKNARTIVERDASFNHLYQIKFEKDRIILTRLINRYRRLYGVFPSALEDLQKVGLIEKIPTDFTGNRYIYNPQTGKIRAKKVYRWKKSS